ncbi:MAG: TonB-dependent receptor [Sulfurimicrobium sp.]|nr:TonB-dependent receptor [Sulfurimicrobium sp.]
MKTHRKYLVLAIAALFSNMVNAEESSNIGRIAVEGAAMEEAGIGLMIREETPKARSTATKENIEIQRSTSSPYQNMALLPGVNAFATDATGLFGGTMTMRGFTSDQLGFTIDGAPVNDSGNFAVYPQEYVDSENLEEVFVTQGSTDTDAPHVGATGGNVGIVSSNPREHFSTRLAQTFGENSLSRTYARLDTGKFANDTTSAFISYSKSLADKWRGLGDADRDHVDAKIVRKLGEGSKLSASIVFNHAVNNFFKRMSLSQYQASGRNYDYATSFPGLLTPGTGTQNENTTVGGINRTDYYALQVNPFENYIATFKGNFKLNDSMRLDIEPYFWHGYGGGGFGTTLAENNSALRALNGGSILNLNGDADTSDTVLFYRSSVTKTDRPGVTTKFNWNIDNHKLMLGYWYERAEHRQTQPYAYVNNDGTSKDVWAENSLAVLSNGTVIQGRNWDTISTSQQLFAQDSISMLNDKLNLIFGVRTPKIRRDGTNYLSLGNTTSVTHPSANYSDTLPSIGARYELSPASHLFANVAKNFRAPSNFILYDATRTKDAVPETSVNTDIGYRYQGDKAYFSGSVFLIDFKDRFASMRDADGSYRTYNAGDVSSKGLELEVGSKLGRGFSTYTSLSYLDSKQKSDFITRNSLNQLITLPTNGKNFVDSPDLMLGLGLQYQSGGWSMGGQLKYTGKRYSTLMNDESVPAFHTVDVNLGYKFARNSVLKNSMIKMNISNLFDEDTLAMIDSSYPNAVSHTANGVTLAGSAPQYSPLAPRFASVQFLADF